MIYTSTFITLILITFILLWLFIKTIDARKWLTLLISVALTPAVFFFVVYPLMNIFSSYHHQKYFSSNDWKTKPALRYEMIDNALNDSIFINKTTTNITSLLGKYEWFSWDTLQKTHDSTKWNYNLGIKPGAFNNKQECLEISFVNNRVTFLKHYKMPVTFNE